MCMRQHTSSMMWFVFWGVCDTNTEVVSAKNNALISRTNVHKLFGNWLIEHQSSNILELETMRDGVRPSNDKMWKRGRSVGAASKMQSAAKVMSWFSASSRLLHDYCLRHLCPPRIAWVRHTPDLLLTHMNIEYFTCVTCVSTDECDTYDVDVAYYCNPDRDRGWGWRRARIIDGVSRLSNNTRHSKYSIETLIWEFCLSLFNDDDDVQRDY